MFGAISHDTRELRLSEPVAELLTSEVRRS